MTVTQIQQVSATFTNSVNRLRRKGVIYTVMKYLIVVAALICTSVWAQPPVKPGPRVPKIKIFRANPHRLTAIRLQGTDPYDAPDDDYICSGTARRPKVARPHLDDELSDYVQVRLAVARARAMARYRELHA